VDIQVYANGAWGRANGKPLSLQLYGDTGIVWQLLDLLVLNIPAPAMAAVQR